MEAVAQRPAIISRTDPQSARPSITSQMTLDRLTTGVPARVVALRLQGPERRRLMDLGFVPGASISVELDNPIGDPRAFRVMDGVIAVRREQASAIIVEVTG